ncbi:cytochrome P450 [Annulohypoxylon maeteangense]|uniref:cytochrome P450 n=1 Tax=Annulohypoxylon maeteangense TaxID=1927788 RepID=UPI0020083FF2|nr:cytochrome P450 [Annulohypoxylon maeteangense]KAI0887803.1 cytochrome P450 [Annulohypoxylon maeteangense]
MEAIAKVVEERGPVLASVAVILVTAFIASLLVGGSDNSNIPLVGTEVGNAEKRRKAFITNGYDFYKKGYDLFRSKAFRLTGLDGDRIVLPRSLMEEVRQLPDDVININKAFDIMNEQKHLGMGDLRQTEFLIHVIRGDLTRSLVRINPRLSDETARTIRENLPESSDEWTSVVAYQTMLTIVATISGAIFIGPELCRSEDYLKASIGYTLDFINAVTKLKQWSRRWRWFGRYFTPEVDKLFAERKKAHIFLRPVIEQRRAAMAAGHDLPDDTLQWMLNKVDEFGLSDDNLAETQLNLSMAAIHTTTLTVTMILYDLVIRPDVIEEVREEIETVLAANGGVMTSHALFEMKLLDSVMKESQRVNPGSMIRFQRYVAKPVTLSDGTHLPAGYMIETPHALTVQDPEVYRNPEVFDPHRFLNLRNGTSEDLLGYKNKEQHQFVTVTKDFMHFGYGRHSCPGRFFAANEIKLILARVLLDYDIKMPPGLTERYANLKMGTDAFPDPTKEILFKRVASTS